MQIFYCLFLVVSFALFQQTNNQPFKIAITAEGSTIVAGADISIEVSLTNTSNQDVDEGVVYWDGIGLDTTLRFEVRDEHGRLVPKRTYPHEELRTGRVRFRTIAAGQTLTQPQLVSALYDMSKPGKYTIQVSRGAPDKDGEIKSNIVTVTVTPSGKDPARKNGSQGDGRAQYARSSESTTVAGVAGDAPHVKFRSLARVLQTTHRTEVVSMADVTKGGWSGFDLE